MGMNKVRGFANVACFALYSILCLLRLRGDFLFEERGELLTTIEGKTYG
jgi:hypothetical protein